MLEMFFDSEKVFSVFEKILKLGSEEVDMAELLYNMNIPVEDAAEILQSFVFLGILEETDKTQSQGIFRFNPSSDVVIAICFFDDIVGRFALNKMKEIVEDGEDSIFSFSKEKTQDEDRCFGSIKDFEEFLKENGLEL